MFDADCDLAAVVYAPDEDPDEVLRSFVRGLQEQGRRVVGMIQEGRHCTGGPVLAGTFIHDGRRIRLDQDLGSCAQSCRLDPAQLMAAGVEIAAAIAPDTDLLVVNRFGKLEEHGRGLGFLIEQALEADIPVVVAVAQGRFSEWIRYAAGMSVRLPCDVGSLLAWWRARSSDAGARAADMAARDSICALVK